MTELIVRELRLRGFDGIAPTVSPSPTPVAASGDEARQRSSDDRRLERLAARHSCRRVQPADLGL